MFGIIIKGCDFMQFEILTIEEYLTFFNSFKYSHFLQSVTWGLVNKETRNKEPVFVGLKKDNKVLAAALLLKKKMPFNLCYYYCPRGYLLDFNNQEILTEFTKGMKEFLKSTNAIYVKINPEIMYQEIDKDGKRIPNSKNNISIYNSLLTLGYIHQGFVKLYENNEPRYSFRRYFEKYQSMEEIDKSISKTFMKTVRRSYTYNLSLDTNGNVGDFYELNKSNAAKDDFIQYPDKFYKTLYKYGKEYKNVMVFNIKVNGQKLYSEAKTNYNKLKNDLENNNISKKNLADSKEKLIRLEQDLKTFEPYKDKEDFVICSMINGLANDMMWTMYIGNNKLGEYLFAVNRVYYETIKYCFENHYRFLDLYGTSGDPNTTYKNLGGLHKYKERFGDTYIEFIGEFDLVNKKVLYKVLPMLLKIYRKSYKLIKKH